MELLYVYIENDDRNIHECGFNLSSRFYFEYDKGTNTLKKIGNKNFIPGFWGRNINCITAVIGKNGSGKSNLLEYIALSMCGSGYGKRRLFVWMYKARLYSNMDVNSEFEIGTNKFMLHSSFSHEGEESINDTLMLYYSPHIDKIIKPKYSLTNFEDISTGKLVRINKFHKEIYYRYPDVEYMQIKDTFRQIMFFLYFNDEFLPKDITVPEYLEVCFQKFEGDPARAVASRSKDVTFESKLKGVLDSYGYGVNHNNLSLFEELCTLYNEGNIKCSIRQLEGLSKTRTFKFKIKRTALNTKLVTALFEYYFKDGLTWSAFSSVEASHSVINNNSVIKWDGLSSGELAIYNLLSRIFSKLISKHSEIFEAAVFKVHLNKNSKYKNIILLLDEPEISFHPEWQKRFLNTMINALSNTFQEFKFQIVIASHSPIIASDFPTSNIVFLNKTQNGKCIVEKSIETKRTFGANIYSLYRDSFFLDGLPIGDFAKKKISDLFEMLEYGHCSPSLLHQIDLIGEPIIRDQLLDIYKQKCSKQEKIALLQREIEELKRSDD